MTVTRKAKVAVVAGGYVLAFLLAEVAVAVHVASTSGPDRQAAGGMYGFGDTLLFVAAFSAASVPATGALLYFLRPRRGFWRFLSIAAPLIAATDLPAILLYSAAGVLRIFAAPPLALLFGLCAVFAPDRKSRIILLASTAVEVAAFVIVAIIWLQPHRAR
jgi:hypothetical protein